MIFTEIIAAFRQTASKVSQAHLIPQSGAFDVVLTLYGIPCLFVVGTLSKWVSLYTP